MSQATDTAATESSLSGWERGFDHVVVWTPYVTLLLGASLALAGPGQSSSERLISLGLTVVAAIWTLIMFTLTPKRRESQPWVRTYFVGLIVISTAMMFHQPAFFPYVITGFIHAFVLKPAPLAFVGVGVTSLVINSQIIFPDPTTDELWSYGIIFVIQTVAVGFGIIGGEKISDLSEQRRQALLDLQAVLDENAGLHAQLVAQAREAGVDDERQRMAREIHDTIAQGLTGVITQLEAASQVRENPEELERHLDNAAKLARESLTEARRSVQAVLPVPLVDRGLPEALADVVSDWSSISGMAASITTTGTAEPLHPEVEIAVLRVTQEALANAAKHSGASRVGVTLSYMGDIVTLDVRDDGTGFIPGRYANGNRSGNGFGLTSMRQRVEGLAGTLEVESEPGGGTAVSATLPALPLTTARG